MVSIWPIDRVGGTGPLSLISRCLNIVFLIGFRQNINLYMHFRKLKDESLGLPGSGLDVVEADVIVSSVVVEADFDAVTDDIIVESGVLVSIGVI